MVRRMARVLFAMGASLNQRSPNWPKLLASFRRRSSRCFSRAGDCPSETARREGLEACAKLIDGCPGPYCFGDQVTLADICLVPQLVNARRFGARLDWPRILEIEAACLALPAFRNASPEEQPDAE